MTKCIVHIGMHKTGSTSIQHSLDGFSDERFFYANLGDDPNHSLAVYSLFAPQPEQHHIHKRHGADVSTVAAYSESVRAGLEQSIASAANRTLLISGEDISVIPAPGLLQFRDYLRARFDEIRIVAYVRPPAAFIASAFQQRVKGGSVKEFNLDREYSDYRHRFIKFDEIFGQDNVYLWKFDPQNFLLGCAVRDFCSRLGISLPESRIIRLNESLPREIVALLYTYRKVAPQHPRMTPKETQELLERMEGIGNTPFRFSPDVLKPVLEKYKQDIFWMESRLTQSLREELETCRPGDVRNEADLLTPDPEVVKKLAAIVHGSSRRRMGAPSAEEVARLVHSLRIPPKRGLLEKILSWRPRN